MTSRCGHVKRKYAEHGSASKKDSSKILVTITNDFSDDLIGSQMNLPEKTMCGAKHDQSTSNERNFKRL